MPYCTLQDLIERFGEEELIQLTDREHTGVLDELVFEQARSDAEAEIDSHLAARYILPLDGVPLILVRIACEITRYYLYSAHPTDTVKDRYEKALQTLKSAVRGEVRLGRERSTSAQDTAGMPAFDGGRNVFKGGGF